MLREGASDLHITTDSPPVLRVDGELIATELPDLTREQTRTICTSVLTPQELARFEQNAGGRCVRSVQRRRP